MSAGVRRRPPARARRKQAERTADTRGRILRAVVESISEVGFGRTTASEIAGRAGVTWGAVQHHFGGKDGILRAVLEDSFARFEERLADVPAGDAPVEERVAAFVSRAWEHFASPHYRSTFEILVSEAGRGGGAGASSWQAAMFRAWDRLWRRLFGDASVSPRRSAELQRFTIAVLSGAACLKLLGGPDARDDGAELALLERTLVRELGGQRT